MNFSQIPSNMRKPGVVMEENTQNAILGLYPVNDRVVIIAQDLASGSVDQKIPTSVFSDADAALYFGQGSIAHLAARAAFEANPNVSLSVVGIDDNGSAKATGTVIIDSTTVAKSGTLSTWIGDQIINLGYPAGVLDATGLAANLVTACSSYANLLPVTFAATDSTVTFTSKNAGTVGNMIPISLSDSVGQNVATSTAMTGGSTDPDVGVYTDSSSLLYTIASAGYSIIINTLPQTENAHGNATNIESMVDWASGAMEQRPAIQIFAASDLVDTYANIKKLCGTDLNSGRATCAYISYASDNLAKTEYFKVAAAYGAMLATQSDPAVPYDGLVLDPLAPPAVIDRFSRNAQEDMLKSGITPLEVIPGEKVSIVRAVTTFTTDSYGQPSIVLLDVNTIRTLDYVRAQIRSRLTQDFKRQKLSPRILKSIKTEIIDVLYLLESMEITQNTDTWKAGVTVGINSTDPTRVDCEIPANIVSGLHVIAGKISLIL